MRPFADNDLFLEDGRTVSRGPTRPRGTLAAPCLLADWTHHLAEWRGEAHAGPGTRALFDPPRLGAPTARAFPPLFLSSLHTLTTNLGPCVGVGVATAAADAPATRAERTRTALNILWAWVGGKRKMV